MPQIRIHGIDVEKIRPISTSLVDNLTEIVGCPRDYFVIECIHSCAVKDGDIVPVPPFVEIVWFDRGQEVQDRVAQEITRQIQTTEVDNVDIAFAVFKKYRYYENGEHF